MRFTVLSTVASMAAIVVPAMAQTPLGYSPATTNTFTVKFRDTIVTPGGAIKLQDTATVPTIDFSNASGNSTHIVTMLDLDAPMGNADRSYSPLLHWMAAISAGDKTGDAATDVAAYVGPQPPVGYGKHRYVLLLLSDASAEFHLPSGFENATYTEITSRLQFPIEKFIAAGNYQVVAANWFTTENTTATTNNTNTTTTTNNPSNPSTSAPGVSSASGLQVSVSTVAILVTLICFHL